MIGKVLQARYQIVQNLGAGVFGQTYIAEDIIYPKNPKCVVKQLRVNSYQSSYLDYLRLRFLTETESLKHLGRHDQIPELITCFEEDEQFYLVQEFIQGNSLTKELRIHHRQGKIWNASEVVELLKDVLGILEFVHSQGFIHCNIKPENLIRRDSDGKLVLVDFGSILPIDFNQDVEFPIYQIPVTALGYLPPEQFLGQTQPSSDLYALGMIAIHALTGITPLQLQIDIDTNEIIWRDDETPVNDYLAAILSQMIRFDFPERFQSAADVLRVLKQMTWETLPEPVLITHNQSSQITSNNEHFSIDKSSPLLTGIKVGLVVNSVLAGVGVYSLINDSPSKSAIETLSQATAEYQGGDLQDAIALAKSIPPYSNVYPEAQTTIEEWQEQWQIATENYLVAEQALNDGRWSDGLRAIAQIPDILYWQSKTAKLVEQAQTQIEIQAKDLLFKAYERAEIRDFSGALNYLRQIPPESSAGAIVQKKLAEYSKKRQVRAEYFLYKAHKKASTGDFSTAVKLLAKIPQDTPVYARAQIKLNEYAYKQNLINEPKNIAILDIGSNPSKTNSATPTKSVNKNLDLQEESYLQEVNISH